MATPPVQAMGKVERVMLIVIEGPPRVGKTSLAEALPGSLRVSESGASSPAPCLADFTRSHSACFDPIERFLLYAARTAVKARAASEIHQGDRTVIVLDRLHASLHVLGVATLGLDEAFVSAVLNGHVTRGLSPDLTIFLDCGYTTYRQRAQRRGDGLLLNAAEYETQRQGFRQYFEVADLPALWLDTSDVTPAQVSQTILTRLPTSTSCR